MLGVENNVESIKSSIQANEDQTTSVLDTAIAKRLIITARALDGTEEPKTELTEADIVDEATEDSSKNTDQVYDEDNEGDDDELVRTTETGLYTSTEMISTTTRQERDSLSRVEDSHQGGPSHGVSDTAFYNSFVINRAMSLIVFFFYEVEDDLHTSSTNIEIHQRRSDGTEDPGHQVLYARLKHPIRPTEVDNVGKFNRPLYSFVMRK